MFYYEAEVFTNGVVKYRFFDRTIENLKTKVQKFIDEDEVEKIAVRKVEEVGYFKVEDKFKYLLELEGMML